DVAEHVASLTRERAEAIGQRALRRVLGEHTYERRGDQVDALLRREIAAKREKNAA
ncbi:glycosyltransferase, partial [Hansschlegelia beijingensis]